MSYGLITYYSDSYNLSRVIKSSSVNVYSTNTSPQACNLKIQNTENVKFVLILL